MSATPIQPTAHTCPRVVLVTDDEEQVARLCRALLERAGYRVLTASDGLAALALSRQYTGEIDVLLSDVDLPGMSGIALAHQITRERPSIGVLLASGNPDHADLSGFAFLAKPFSGEALRNAIAQVLPPVSTGPVEMSGLREGAESLLGAGRLHLSGDQLEAYAGKRLLEPEISHCEEHLLLCQQCREALEQEEAFVSAMRSAARGFVSSRGEAARSPLRWPRMIPAWSVVTAVLLLALPFGLYRWTRRPVPQPYIVELVARRGLPVATVAATGRPLVLKLQTNGAPDLTSYLVEMVDQNGQMIWRQRVLARGSEVRAQSLAPRPGVYFIRLYAAPDRLVGEYGMRVVTK
ncbi:MAG: response regulator [Acidobacteriia bacterium]|nr:response regulator [Terriglobia bacterium]